MITFIALELDDFGPYKGHQRLEFPPEGVTIVYGENGTGKTILLNAFRFALFGHILGRSATAGDLEQLVNSESRNGRLAQFRVILEFEADGASYRLTRQFGSVSGATEARTIVSLAKDGSPLGPDQTSAQLRRLIPETISRFFLFDGELLQQYEELVKVGSAMADQIKESAPGDSQPSPD